VFMGAERWSSQNGAMKAVGLGRLFPKARVQASRLLPAVTYQSCIIGSMRFLR
jgi:hypothetical protein